MGRGARLDVALGRAARDLEPRDRAFVHELVYGAARLRGRLDHVLSGRVRGGLARLDPVVLEVLRLGAYQILYMDGVPRYAAVSQAVAQAAGGAGRGAASLVNAVLRALGEGDAAAARFPRFEEDPAGFLATWGSHPRWLVERWLTRWSASEVRDLVNADNRRPDTHLVPLRDSPEHAVRGLAERGIGAEAVGRGTLAVRLETAGDTAAALDVIPAVVQDPAAHLVVRYADPPEGTVLADLCAAPGGKALALAGRSVYTLAADRSGTRMRLVRENALRTGIRVGMVVADARRPPVASADAVVVDVPCSGTGTLGRHPDSRWRLAPESMNDMIQLQGEILDAGAGLVPRGGVLVYATCSLEPEENHARVAAFLERHRAFELEPTGAVDAEYVDGDGYLVVLPQRHGFDGAFAARMRRTW